METEDDAALTEAIRRIANKIVTATNNEPIQAVQVALANIVAQLALTHGASCDRVFLETLHGMFEVYREASNHKLRNEDPQVS